MPTFQGKTVYAEQVWKSPDGKMTMFEVTLDVNGQQATAKTYSQKVAQVGFSGELESYEKDNKKGGIDTFVKQPQRENSGYGGGGNRGGGKASSDPFTMYLSYAKDIAVAMLSKTGTLDEAKYGAVLDAVLTGGKTLFEGREAKPSSDPLPEAPPDGIPSLDDAPDGDFKKSLSDIFGKDANA